MQLINDILDLSKIEAGTIEFVYAPRSLDDILLSVKAAMMIEAEGKGLTLKTYNSLRGHRINTDANRLNQVITNLITNAVKFTEKGEITCRCSLTEDKRMLRFDIEDTGCGIPANKLDSIFKRFVKLNNFVQGTGLGLSICKIIVEHMGGTIGVTSEEGKGSHFWFKVPYIPADKVMTSTPHKEKMQAKKEEISILVAEDNESNFKLFKNILQHDFKIYHAWNGLEAVEIYKEKRPHIILMDINMPVMDGYEATKEIRKISNDVPIMAITAYAYASDEQRILSQGFDYYFSKPINVNELHNKLSEIISKRMILL